MATTSSNSRCALLFDTRLRAVAAILAAGLLGGAGAAEVRLDVRDEKGVPVADAIVWAEIPGSKRPAPRDVEVVQKQRLFLPPVTVIPVGSTVRFPNRDDVQHHVYSFSKAKKFDLPLYIGESPGEIVFDRPGIVTLGCNIHDWMAAHIVVVDTPFVATSNDSGAAVLRSLAGSQAIVRVWHPRLRGEPIEWVADLVRGPVERTVTLKLRPDFRRTPPDSEGGTYR